MFTKINRLRLTLNDQFAVNLDQREEVARCYGCSSRAVDLQPRRANCRDCRAFVHANLAIHVLSKPRL